jgi:hypothetical protein
VTRPSKFATWFRACAIDLYRSWEGGLMWPQLQGHCVLLRRLEMPARQRQRRLAFHDRADIICPRGGGSVSPRHPRRLGQDLCGRVAFEVQVQTCPAAVVAGLVSASGSAEGERRDEVPRRPANARVAWAWSSSKILARARERYRAVGVEVGRMRKVRIGGHAAARARAVAPAQSTFPVDCRATGGVPRSATSAREGGLRVTAAGRDGHNPGPLHLSPHWTVK